MTVTDPLTTPQAPVRAAGGGMRRLTMRLAPVAGRLAGSRWFPLWAVLHHVGRTSGNSYVTTVVARRTRDGFLIPMPFGSSTQWVRNLVAAGRGTLRVAGHEYAIDQPQVVGLDSAAADLPAWIRVASRRLGIRLFVRVRSA